MSDKLRILLNSASQIAKEREAEKLIPILADLARELLDVDRCSLFLYDNLKNTLYTLVAHGGVRIEVPADAGIVGASFKSGEILLIPDAYADPRFNREVDKATGYRTRNILAVPLTDSKGNVLGVFQAINKLDGGFSAQDVDLLSLLATYASNSIEAGMLYERIKSAYKETVMRLSYAAEYKDPETYNHIVRIGMMSSLIAQKLGYDEEYCYNLQLAAPMHDIGKIGVPDAILLKKGKLEGEEWEIMKRHTIIGYEILKDSDSELLQMAARISLEHHEKWDGTGYPYGKKGEDICIEARITAIVDVFDALTSERPYKPAWSVEETSKYMKELSGKHFDPNLLEVFFENMPEILKIKQEFAD
ncbi:MAG: HD domain-containing protein [Aquificaceae bacterium]|nr:HD domain-containing protein [Aquificaceae bacterium]